MSIIINEQHDLVATLHRGTLGTPPWTDFLDQLRRRTEADHAWILFRGGHKQSEVIDIVAGPAVDDEMRQHYREEFTRLDAAPHRELRSNRVYSLDEFLDPARPYPAPDHARPAGQFMAKLNLRFARILRVKEPSGSQMWVVTARDKRDFDGSDTALLGSLAQHLEVAISTYSALTRQQLRAGISADVMRRLNFGWFTLDSAGRIIDMSDQTEALMFKGGALYRSADGKLVPRSRTAQVILRKFLQDADGGHPSPEAIHLSDEPWLDMLVMTPRTEISPSIARPTAVGFVHGEQPTTTERSGQLMALFGLSLQEARLALLISRGLKIAEAADVLGLTRETARLYSKRIYAKTGTRGQADLVRLILASIVALT